VHTLNRFALATLQGMLHQFVNDRDLRNLSLKLYSSGNLDPVVMKKVDDYLSRTKGKFYEHSVLTAACSLSENEIEDLVNQAILSYFSNGSYWAPDDF
jgi:hypothetical protein